MSQNEANIIFGNCEQVEMNLSIPKMEDEQFEALGLHSNTLTTIASNGHHYATTSNDANATGLDDVMVSTSSVITDATSGISIEEDHRGDHESYENIQYVTEGTVVPIQQGQEKFSDPLVSVDTVTFVEMNDNLKNGTVTAPLDLYFGVIPPTTMTQVAPTTSSHSHIKHEHMNPKAQILERVYSDYVLQEQQKQNTNTGQIVEIEEPVIIPHTLEQLDPKLLSQNTVSEFRRPIKMTSHMRQNSHMQERHVFQDAVQNINANNVDTINEQLPIIHLNKSAMQRPHNIQKIDNRNINMQRECLESSQPNVSSPSSLNHLNRHLKMNTKSTSTVDHSSGSQSYNIQNQNTQMSTMPLVSRSGRPIRRRPEYIAYVNESNQSKRDDEEMLVSPILPNRQTGIKLESTDMNLEVTIDEHPLDSLLDNVHQEGNQFSNEEEEEDDDMDESSQYNSNDGKKSLPHKKRIPKKLKTNKRSLKNFKCLPCNESFSNQQQLNQHKLSHTPSPDKANVFNCELCVKNFDNQLKFFEHLKTHYEPFKKHKCEVCSGEFDSAETLQEHSQVHSREHYKCELCNKTFRKESMLEVHIKVTHLEEDDSNLVEKPYTCMVCPKSFRNQIALDTHVQTDHTENPPEFNCEDCYRVFKSQTKLQTHRKIEHKEENVQGKGTTKKKNKNSKGQKVAYQCTMCPRTFIHKNSLVYHIRGHTGERPHPCDQCDKAFFAASALKVHQRLHSGEKPYKCNDCGKFFRQWGDLRYHTTSVHSDARQYQCEYCGKDFKRKYCLVVHRRIHTGEKNYKCEYCLKAFRAASYLQNHIRIHTGERPHPCPDCGKPFRVRSDMRRHRQTHMRDNNNSASAANNAASAATSNDNANTVTSVAAPTVNQLTTQSSANLARPTIHQGQLQIVQGSIAGTAGQHQLIITDANIANNDQAIRIMVSGLGTQHVANTVNPPPAHRRNVINGISIIGPTSPREVTNQDGTSTISPEVIMLDESASQPINFNTLPRILTQTQVNSSSSSHNSQDSIVTTEKEYQLATNGRNTIEMRDEENVYVWHGIFNN